MNSQDLIFWIWFAEAVGGSSYDFRPLLEAYSSPYEIYHAEEDELQRFTKIPDRLRMALLDKNLERAASILDSCQRLGIGIMTYQSQLYPHPLREMKDPPVLLYYAGTVPSFENRLCVGMVGTRNMSVYGAETAYKISYELALANVIVVSGMAAGIDGVCAAGAMRAGGTTVAVLGCGLDITYPKHHGKLMQEIADKGLILSEYPPGTRPVSYHFPVRNRIISALSHAVVVVEANEGSGSLITAKLAVTQGKDVFAVPAYGDGLGYESANGLMRDGAFFAAAASDILNRYRYVFPLSIRSEALQNVGKRSACDYEYLIGMGVLKSGLKPNRAVGKPTADAEPIAAPKPKPEKTVEELPLERKRSERVKMPADRLEKDASPQKQKDRTPDDVLQSLDPVGLAILQTIPDDRAVTVDELGNLGYSSGEIITALTMLELMGLVQKLPGALYRKA